MNIISNIFLIADKKAATIGGQNMEDKTKDALDELDKEIKWAIRIGPQSYPWIDNNYEIARKYKKVAEGLNEESRKIMALRTAAEYYVREARYYSNPYKDRDYKSALEIYEQIGDLENITRLRSLYQKEKMHKVRSCLKNIIDKDYDWAIHFSDIRKLSFELSEAGFLELSVKYQRMVEEITTSAKEDLETLSNKAE
jgi:hypothetical protein